MSIEAVLKNCALCHDYNIKATSSEKEELVLGFYRLRDESTNRALEYLKGYIADCQKEADDMQRKIDNTDDPDLRMTMIKTSYAHVMHWTRFVAGLSSLCLECDYSSPRIMEAIRDREVKKKD
jgi:hypothetical protein